MVQVGACPDMEGSHSPLVCCVLLPLETCCGRQLGPDAEMTSWEDTCASSSPSLKQSGSLISIQGSSSTPQAPRHRLWTDVDHRVRSLPGPEHIQDCCFVVNFPPSPTPARHSPLPSRHTFIPRDTAGILPWDPPCSGVSFQTHKTPELLELTWLQPGIISDNLDPGSMLSSHCQVSLC